MTTKRKILLSGIGKRNALIQLINDELKHFDATLIGVDALSMPPARLAVPEFEKLPLARDVHFKEKYIDLLNNNNVDAHLTIIDPEIPVLGEIEADDKTQSQLLNPPKNTSVYVKINILLQ